MKSVLLSIKFKYAKLIMVDEKIFEVRKSKPKLNPPFSVYFYIPKTDASAAGKAGLIIGMATCDYIKEVKDINELKEYSTLVEGSCVTLDQIKEYSKGKSLYFWHLTNPEEFLFPYCCWEFYKPCIMPEMPYCPACEYGNIYISEEEAEFASIDGGYNCEWNCMNRVSRAPQSWCYVDGIDESKTF